MSNRFLSLASAVVTVFAVPFIALAGTQKYEIHIDGMTCSACVQSVTKALEKLPLVEKGSVQVALKEKRATLTLTEAHKEIAAEIKRAIEEAGYTVTTVTTLENNSQN